VQLLFTNIKVKKINAYSYERASKEYYSNDIFYNCIRISEVLKEKRGKKTKGIVLNEVSNSYVKYNNDIPYLYKDTVTERLMKQMIAEFAIFANSFVGEYLRIHFDGIGLYRSCDAKDWLNTVYSGITGQELLNEIIINGIKAEYISNVESHDLVGSQEYCHFTSPIRRLSDCVCHYLLKYIYLKQEDEELTQPFSNEKLLNFTEICDNMTKSTKNIQYKDSKFRLIQTMNNMILNSEIVNITYYISSFTSAFLNIIICGINEHDVYLSYTLRIANTEKSKDYQIKKQKTLLITKVNCIGKFDERSIPELDALFI
jgi:exoribonuclease R